MSYLGVKLAVETDNKELLLAQFEEFLHKNAHNLIKYPNFNQANYDELVSEGKLAIMRAYEKFDRVKYEPAQFLMYCTRYIQGLMNNKARQIWKEEADHVSLFQTNENDDNNSQTFADTLTSDDNVFNEVSRADMYVRVNTLLDEKFSENEKKYLKMYFEEGINPRKISEQLNIPKNQVRNTIYTALGKLRTELKYGKVT